MHCSLTIPAICNGTRRRLARPQACASGLYTTASVIYPLIHEILLRSRQRLCVNVATRPALAMMLSSRPGTCLPMYFDFHALAHTEAGQSFCSLECLLAAATAEPPQIKQAKALPVPESQASFAPTLCDREPEAETAPEQPQESMQEKKVGEVPGSVALLSKSEGPSNMAPQKSEGPSTTAPQKSEGPSFQPPQKSEGRSSQAPQKSEGPSTPAPAQKSEEDLSTLALQKSEGPSMQPPQKSEGPSTQPVQKSGPSSEPPQKSEGPSTQPPQKSEGPGSMAPQKSEGPSSVAPQKSEGPSNVPQISEGPSSEPPQKSEGPSTQSFQKSEGPSTQPVQKSEGPSTQPPQKSEGPSTQPVQKSEGPGSMPPQKSEGPSTQPPQKSEDPSSEPPQKSEGPSTQPPQKSEGPSSEPPQKSEGPSSEPPQKSEGPSNVRQKLEGPNDVPQSEGPSTLATQNITQMAPRPTSGMSSTTTKAVEATTVLASSQVTLQGEVQCTAKVEQQGASHVASAKAEVNATIAPAEGQDVQDDLDREFLQQAMDAERSAITRAEEAEARATYLQGLLRSILATNAEANEPATAEQIHNMLRRPGTADLAEALRAEALQAATAVVEQSQRGLAATAAPGPANEVAPVPNPLPSKGPEAPVPDAPMTCKEEFGMESDEGPALEGRQYVPTHCKLELSEYEEAKRHKDARASYMRYYRSIRAPSSNIICTAI